MGAFYLVAFLAKLLYGEAHMYFKAFRVVK